MIGANSGVGTPANGGLLSNYNFKHNRSGSFSATKTSTSQQTQSKGQIIDTSISMHATTQGASAVPATTSFNSATATSLANEILAGLKSVSSKSAMSATKPKKRHEFQTDVLGLIKFPPTNHTFDVQQSHLLRGTPNVNTNVQQALPQR